MRIDEREVYEGMNRGVDRAERYFGREWPELGSISRQALANPEAALIRALASWPEELHERFQGLFAELYAIAASARFVNNEPPLTFDHTMEFLASSSNFFNSLKHRR